MQSFLQIVFHPSVDTYNAANGNSFWWDFFKGFILPIGLASLAAYVAYYIFVKETKRDRAVDEAKKEEERTDKLISFSALVESALRSSVQQKNNIKQQIRRLRKITSSSS